MMNNEDINFKFWKRFDKHREGAGFSSLKKFADYSKIPEQRMKNQRSRNQIPKIYDLLTISKLLGVSTEYLVTGADSFAVANYPYRIKAIAEKLTKVSEFDLTIIERSVELLPIEKSSKANAG